MPPHTDLHQGPGLALHCKPEVAELTEAGVGGRQPVLQAAAVNGPQGPRALAGGQQLLVAAALVADPTDGTVIEGAAAGEGEKTAGQCTRLWYSLFLRRELMVWEILVFKSTLLCN